MFYSQFILAKKGPLGTIWIAAHLERKLRKNQVADTDIGVSVDSILFPEVPIALRLSSHLLLGVVRIYSRKVNYLFDDCSEALLKVKQAFRSTAVDLPPEESTAPYHSITLPETFDLDDFELPDNDIFQGNYVDHHVSTREQITLQDTMEGVVYTTSQFGLDERFGDGDASQIGLDLDEVLLLDKAATLEHDDLTASPQVSHQKDEKFDALPAAAEVSGYAQGPSTPGLEEPNLIGTLVDLVNNEVDYHNSADLVSMETMQKESSADHRENDAIDCSLQNNGKHVDADLHHEDNDSTLVEVESKREEQEHLACMVVMKDQENLVPNDHCLTSSPLVDSSNKEYQTTLLQECAGKTTNASDILEKVKDSHDGVVMNDELVVAPLDQTVTKCVVFGGVNVNETVASPNCSHVTSDQEDLSGKLLSGMDGSQRPESDGHVEDDKTLSKHEVLNDIEISKSEGQSFLFDGAQVSNVISPPGSPGRPEVVDVEAQASQEVKEAEANLVSHEAVQPTESYLRPCTSHPSQPSLSSFEGEKCHETDVSDPALGYHEIMEPSVCKGTPHLEKSDVQLGSQIFSNGVESINKSAASDIPEPEKMLFLAYQHGGGEANDLLMESTPDKQGISEGQTDATGVKSISGKKRSFTESTLTMQSVDLVESYGGAQSKRIAESIPDDDDLLSSILVGRRSSVLKVKPSPAAPEIASTKRLRSGTRTSALKRKVLMDDMMVLHGDTIRQQLTNTEDIRRTRKKAPCTRHEISMIQRQFLEDAIFHESIFTGLSADLTILRNEALDLTGIMVFDHGLDNSFIEKTNDQESYPRTNTEIHGVEGNNEPMAVPLQEDAEAQPTEIPLFSESHQSEVNLGSHDIEGHGHTNIISHVKQLDSSENAEMNNADGNIKVSEAENCSVGPGHESSSVAEVFENDLCMANDFVASLPLLDKTNDLGDSMHTDILSIPNAQNLNTNPILEDEFIENKGDSSGVGAIEFLEHSMEIRTQVQTDGLEANDLYASLDIGSKETNEYTDNQAPFNGDLPMEENGHSMLGGLNEDQIVASGLGCDDKDAKSGCTFSENTEVDCLHSVALVLDEKEIPLNDEENPVCREAGLQSTMCPEISAIRSPFVDHNDENDMVANDTGFLNVGDDEIIEDDDDFIPRAEGTHLENSGWSSRTRAVAKYLQTVFDKEDLQGRQNLHLDNLLVGKTRKEASRMFFETLVLKTRDYVHVEQTKPFANVNIKPRMKLMKSDF
ncbi:sister chromatid cohesion 1 protein 4 [Gastrolobium bilobum]|uniref:sister chromatid cohesion 1 protein 4 n=1 Tax=Gastrolobium bilobum TaxID=150636 RepID=UPI002AB0C475|nr:sister chromatid cohesion 1 protein 4 [Gastrolobium bilobum]